MRQFRIRNDLQRAVIDGFALPLGIEPGKIVPPQQGYTVSYTPGQEDDRDTYCFHVVVSHERLAVIVNQIFKLLPEQVFAIVEIGSRDAYRSVDVFLGEEPISRELFLETWRQFESVFLEDGSLGAGANSDEPFIEVFLDQWKGLSIHVPLSARDDIEEILVGIGVQEVVYTWPGTNGDAKMARVRPVLELTDEFSPDLDELLLELRHEWQLGLNIDPRTNEDDGGRQLGMTLWHAIVIAEDSNGDPDRGAYASVWATAGSMDEMEQIIVSVLDDQSQWSLAEVYTIDRIAFDERPDELGDLAPRREKSEVHLVQIDPWDVPPDEVAGD